MDNFDELLEQEFQKQRELKQTYLKIIVDSYEKFYELSLYVMQDVVDSYDKLIQQRKECIDKYIKILELLHDDKEFNAIKPIQSLMEKKHKEITDWEQEIAPLVELINLGDNPSDEKVNELIDKLNNI